MTPVQCSVAGLLCLAGVIAGLRLVHVTWPGALAPRLGRLAGRVRAEGAADQRLTHLAKRLRDQRRQLAVARRQQDARQDEIAAQEQLLGAEREAVSEARSLWVETAKRRRAARQVSRSRRRQTEGQIESAREQMQRQQQQYAAWQAEIAEVRAELGARATEVERAEQRLGQERERFDTERSAWQEYIRMNQNDLADEREKLEAKIREMSSFRLSLHDGCPELPDAPDTRPDLPDTRLSA